MALQLTIGTTHAQPGTVQYGRWYAFDFPTGTAEFLPVIIAQGVEDGPCIWLTAGIHGPEHAGPAVLYNLITQDLVDNLRGTIVALPALCPVGLRTMAYVPYHVGENPNRLWPDGRPGRETDPDKIPPGQQEQAYARLFRKIKESADFLIDYHNASTGSISFVFRDRVLYRADENEESHRAAAESLSQQLGEMIDAYGHTVINEFPVEKYIDEKLHRSTSGAALLVGRIPAFTVELGTGHLPDPAIVAASAAGTRNVLRWAGMLDGEREPIEGIQVVDPGFPVRRRRTPRVETPCVALHTVEAGATISKGDQVADLRDIWGRPAGEVCSEYDGIVIGRAHGIYFSPGDALLSMGIRDENPLVGPYPKNYFRTADTSA